MPFQICKNFCKILNNLVFNQEKLKMCKFPLTGCLQIICNFFRKTYVIGFPKAKFFQNVTSESGSKQRFSLLRKKKLVLKPGFRLKWRALGMQEKSENFNSLRPILFELCKKNYRGGVKLTPSSRNRVNQYGNYKTIIQIF